MSLCITPNCTRPSVARGLCSACYMRERRAAAAGYAGRAPNGSRYPEALQSVSEWSGRFRKHISRAGDCHEWGGTKTKRGYGVFFVAGRTLLAHRLAFVMGGGDHAVPVVMHTCDNPACVNPKHLKAGSYAENTADMDAKGRRNVGKAGEHLKDRQRHPKAKAVHTPFGEFSSAALAAEHIGVHARSVARYCKEGVKGYYYL